MRLRHARAAALALGVILAACRNDRAPAAAAPPPLLGVEVAKCASVVRGPRCLVAADRVIHVFVPGGTSDATVATEAGEIAHEATTGADGRGFEVTVPHGASELTVTGRVAGELRRFRVAVADAPSTPAWLDDARKAKDRGAVDEAARALDEAESRRDGGEDGSAADVASLRARIALARGEGDRAAALLASSADVHADRGELSKAADDLGARAYVLVTDLRRPTEAKATIARLATFAQDYPEAGALALYYTGLLESENGELGTSLAVLADARAKAQRLGVAKITRAVIQVLASTLNAVGRVSDALALLTNLDRDEGASMRPCERATLALNIGASALFAREAPNAREATDPLPPLRRAVAMFGDPCPNMRLRVGALSNLAWGELQAGDVQAARAALADARAVSVHPKPEAALTELETEARATLAGGDARGALRAYERLAAAATGVSRVEEEAAEEGRASALERLGDRRGALAAASRAEDLLDEAARAIPAGDGRGAFWWTRGRVAQKQVELLLALGRTAEALAVARSSQARVVNDVQHAARVESLPPAERARWEEALAEYRRARDAIVADASQDWSLTAEALARKVTDRRAHDVATRARLDEVARALFPRHGPELAPLAEDDDVVGLALVPLEKDWAAFVVERGAVRVARIEATVDPSRAAEAARTLLDAVAGDLSRARRLRLLPFGGLRDVDLNALGLGGQPLVVGLTVEYPLDVGVARDASEEGEEGEHDVPSLVVADATGELPAARREGRAVAAALGARAHLLVGNDATRERVLDELGRTSSLHFAGHGSYEGTDGWESALLLAGRERLTVADILALPRAPARVVLSGCETGREGEAGGGPPGLGLADAFLAAGSRVVIASTRRVDDETTDRLMRALMHAFADAPGDAAAALRRAQLDVRNALPSSDWSAFRAFVR